MSITVIGLDIAKNVFQVHGVDETGQVVLRRRLRRCDVLRLFGELIQHLAIRLSLIGVCDPAPIAGAWKGRTTNTTSKNEEARRSGSVRKRWQLLWRRPSNHSCHS